MFPDVEEIIYKFKCIFKGIQPEDAAPQLPLIYRFHKSDAQKIYSKYTKMYSGVKHDLGFPAAEFDKMTRPIYQWLSEHLLFLPASEFYHHVDPGAFYLHCIQTGSKAAQLASNNPSLFFNVNKEDREKYQINFTYAAWIGGLIHDIGKPVVDMAVYAVSRNQVWINAIPTWNPLEETLTQWAKDNRVKWYRVVFTRQRDKESHELYTIAFINHVMRLIPDGALDKRLIFDFLISINSKTSKLHNIVVRADSLSTAHDVNRYDKVGVLNTPIAHFTRALVDYEFENTNRKNKPYFLSDVGLHLYYPKGIETILEYMFSKMTQSEIDDFKLQSDPDFWVAMLAQRRFLVADINLKPDGKGKYPEIKPYIYNVEITNEGINSQHLCITITKDNRIPINTQEIPLKTVNLAIYEQKEKESKGKIQSLEKTKTKSKSSKAKGQGSSELEKKIVNGGGSEDVTSIKTEPVDMVNNTSKKNKDVKITKDQNENTVISTENIVLTGKANTNTHRYVTARTLTDISMEDDADTNNIDLMSGSTKSKADSVTDAICTNDESNSVENNIPSPASSKDKIVSPNHNYADEDVIKAKFIERLTSYEHSALAEYCLKHKEYQKYPFLVFWLVEIDFLIQAGDINPLIPNTDCELTKEGLSIHILSNWKVFTKDKVSFLKVYEKKAMQAQFDELLNGSAADDIPLFLNGQGAISGKSSVVLQHDIAKMMCFTIKDEVKALIDSGKVYLPLGELK
ncbi:TraI domain-containing protein [Thalassotalea piscium]|uniref:Uncharacterized domain-containing protein n=1 Tax=Thalassotalea piscium TaxID=1230533 RepID=A0A7X0NGJ9_9GAMM|nr:TraI domain-containing protein [Thalassotalea piscium]MBB6543054.1 hypothetical protein [Thalassotalea piscium]